jgi:hypothetical protein
MERLQLLTELLNISDASTATLMVGPAKIVVRYADGKILKGYSHDFSPFSSQFHVRRHPVARTERGQQVFVRDLKAVFFVRDFYGDNSREERKHFVGGKVVSGRKVEVVFTDGEVLVGTTTGYDPQRLGFFLFPADTRSNNARVFVVITAIKIVRFL